MSSGELLDLSTKRESAPSKRWWLYFRVPAHASVVIDMNGVERNFSGPGILSVGPVPSHEIAEQVAQEILASGTKRFLWFDLPTSKHPIKYLGAYPEGESPP